MNNYGFEVERRNPLLNPLQGVDANAWEKIGFVKGNGNSNSPKSYSFIDDNPLNGRAEYRLKQVDNDGNHKYSSIVTVTSIPAQFSLEQNYPNPFNPTTAIKYSLPFSSNVKLVLYNMLGQQVKVLVNGTQGAGYYKYQWNADNFPSGVYIYLLNANSTDGQKNYKSVKKMVLLK